MMSRPETNLSYKESVMWTNDSHSHTMKVVAIGLMDEWTAWPARSCDAQEHTTEKTSQFGWLTRFMDREKKKAKSIWGKGNTTQFFKWTFIRQKEERDKRKSGTVTRECSKCDRRELYSIERWDEDREHAWFSMNNINALDLRGSKGKRGQETEKYEERNKTRDGHHLVFFSELLIL